MYMRVGGEGEEETGCGTCALCEVDYPAGSGSVECGWIYGSGGGWSPFLSGIRG